MQNIEPWTMNQILYPLEKDLHHVQGASLT